MQGKDVIIVDDLVQTGGTLYECGLALAKAGATSVSAFAAHGNSYCMTGSKFIYSYFTFKCIAVFPNEAWRRFLKVTSVSVNTINLFSQHYLNVFDTA